MRELGEYLKQMRKNRGLNPDQVSEQIRVNVRYIVALEEGQYNVLPAEIYVRGFLKSYAEFLGIDPEELYARYSAELPKKKNTTALFTRKEAEKPKKLTPVEPAHSDEQKHVADFKTLLHTIKSLPPIVYVFAAVALIIAIVAIYAFRGEEETPDSITSAIIGDTLLQRSAAAPSDAEVSQIIRITIDSVNAMQAISVAESLTFDIRTKESVYLLVILDDQVKAFKGDVGRNQKRSYRAKNSMYLEMSNPSNVKISVNGFDLMPLEGTRFDQIEINRQNVHKFIGTDIQPIAPDGLPIPVLGGQTNVNTLRQPTTSTTSRPTPVPTQVNPNPVRTTPTQTQTNGTIQKMPVPPSEAASQPKPKPDTLNNTPQPTNKLKPPKPKPAETPATNASGDGGLR